MPNIVWFFSAGARQIYNCIHGVASLTLHLLQVWNWNYPGKGLARQKLAVKIRMFVLLFKELFIFKASDSA